MIVITREEFEVINPAPNSKDYEKSKETILKSFKLMYESLLLAKNTQERHRLGKIMENWIMFSPIIEEVWNYNPNENLWENRFTKKDEKKLSSFIDERTNLKIAPKKGGLYFLGNTAFNPETNEVQYWVKIGLSQNLYNRLKSYATYNPSTFVIGYKTDIDNNEISYQELLYQKLIKQKALYSNQNNDEWFMVDKETYLSMCKKSFDFFS